MIRKFTPDAPIFIVDDASDERYITADHRFDTRAGIPAAKNKCLELLMERTDSDHFFLFDDDCSPTDFEWWKLYTESGLEHASYTWGRSRKITDTIKRHNVPNGCMIYLTRKAVETVGGFDPAYGLGKFEHTDLSRRIYNAGLTPAPYIDVLGSERVLYCWDQDKAIQRNFSTLEMKQLLRDGMSHFEANKYSKEFINYK